MFSTPAWCVGHEKKKIEKEIEVGNVMVVWWGWRCAGGMLVVARWWQHHHHATTRAPPPPPPPPLTLFIACRKVIKQDKAARLTRL
jgi:hypothetical protein